MNEQETWLAANDRFLEAALEWLRLRLQPQADQAERRTEPERIEPERAEPERAEQAGEPVLVATLVPDQTPIPLPARRRSWWRGRGDDEPQIQRRPTLPSAKQSLPETSTPEPSTPDAIGPEPESPVDEKSTSGAEDVRGFEDLDDVERARRAMVEAEHAMTPPPALVTLAELLELGDFARHLLLLAAAPELDPRVGRTLLQIHGQPWPSFALAAQVLEHPDWSSRSASGPLRHWHLVEVDSAGDSGVSTGALRVDERVLDALKGLDQLDARLAGLVVEVPPAVGSLPASQQATVERAAQLAVTASEDSPLVVVQLVGPSSSSRRLVARHVARALGGELHRLQPRLLPRSAPELDQAARLWHREVLLSGRVLLLDDEDGDASAPEVGAFLARTGGVVLVGGAQVARDLPGSAAVVDVANPTAEEQLELWAAALGSDPAAADTEAEGPPKWLPEIVEQFDLDADSIAAVAASATGRTGASAGEVPVTAEQLWEAARLHQRPRLESVAQRVHPVATWDDLVLPEQQLDQLAQVVSQVRHRHRVHRDWGFAGRMNRGLGVSALFAGESGTGKSMTAEVLAKELDLDLYRIDLSAVVSKYIGETEKNLRHLFDSAEGGGVILFFDEADALFGKRSEVKDAHDRYANIETNYLLQRMEQYGGLAILATNMRSALDRAFTRRLRFVIEFPVPDVESRTAMWERAFPADVPLEALDVDRLARIDLNGAGIASAALAAAFTAAAADRPVAMGDVLGAAREVLRKLQRPVVESQFRWPPLASGRAS